jgi:hypothetical protein
MGTIPKPNPNILKKKPTATQRIANIEKLVIKMHAQLALQDKIIGHMLKMVETNEEDQKITDDLETSNAAKNIQVNGETII